MLQMWTKYVTYYVILHEKRYSHHGRCSLGGWGSIAHLRGRLGSVGVRCVLHHYSSMFMWENNSWLVVIPSFLQCAVWIFVWMFKCAILWCEIFVVKLWCEYIYKYEIIHVIHNCGEVSRYDNDNTFVGASVALGVNIFFFPAVGCVNVCVNV